MRRLVVTALAAVLCLTFTAAASADGDAARTSPTAASCGTVELLSQAAAATVLRFDASSEATALVRVPDRGRVSVELSDIELRGRDGEVIREVEPGDMLAVSSPGIMRDIRLVRVRFLPDGTGLPAGATSAAATVTVTTRPGTGDNEKTSPPRWPSPAFDRIYRSTVINYDESIGTLEALGALATRYDDRDIEGSRYLIITDHMFAGVADSLVEWKRGKGLAPVVVTPPGSAWTNFEIFQYVKNAYDNWEVPPEFLLLVGDTEIIPTGGGTVRSDNYYADLEGNDYLLDILVGRIPADNVVEAQLMLAKTMAYERPWLHDDSVWPTSASLIVREDEQGGNEIYYENSAYIRGLMEDAEFAPIDTLFTRNWSTVADLYDALEEGRGFINYRGSAGAFWIPPFQWLPWDSEPMWELPIVVSATCLTGDYYGDESLCEYAVKAGDLAAPTGAVAFFGTSTHGLGPDLSQRRAWVDEGFFDGVFGDSRTIGEACAAGKTNLYEHSGEVPEYQGWNLMGDPELSLWTAESRELELVYEPVVSEGESIEVTVLDDSAPVPGAVVTVDALPSAFSMAVTDAEGRAVLPLAVSPPCTVRLAAVVKNARPAGGSVRVLAAGPHVLVAGDHVDDSQGGNGDGFVSPGESAEVSLGLLNLGDETATAVVALLRCADPFVALVDSVAAFGDIAPDATEWAEDGFRVEIDEDWPGGYAIPLSAEVTYGDSIDAFALPRLRTVTGDLLVGAVQRDDRSPGGDGDGDPEPGETVDLRVNLENAPTVSITGIRGVLTSRNPDVIVTSAEAGFPDSDVPRGASRGAAQAVSRSAPSGASRWNDSSPFVVSISPHADPGDAMLFLRVTGTTPEYAYAETLRLDVSIAEVPLLHPTGPDPYGYYAYDSSDSLYEAAPDFDWTEIRPPGPGTLVTEVTNENDEVVRYDAPFIIRYYGVNHDDVSICSNGFLSLYDTNFRWGGNSGIPELHGAAGMIAPFWDDLDPSAGGDIYMWHDTAGHRLILEYDEVMHADSDAAETFQVIIYDQAYHPTPSGDAPILFLYGHVGDATSCTVGIENPYQTIGTQFLYNGDYGDYAAPLEDGLAVLFTTAEPESLRFPWLVIEDVTIDDSEGGDGDGTPEAGEVFELIAHVRNEGEVPATGLELTLTSDDPLVAVTEGSASLPEVLPGNVALNADDPFLLAADESSGDTLVTLWLRPGQDSNARQGAMRLDLRIGEEPEVPTKLALGPSRPNPFSTGTTLALSLPAAGRVTAKVYDVAGRLVSTIADSPREAGECVLEWDGTNGDDRPVASGVYFIRVEAAGKTRVAKAVLLR